MTNESIFGQLYEKWARAVAERDRDTLEELFSPGYTYTSPDGQRMSREEILEIEMEVPPPQLPFEAFQVERFGNVAIVRGAHLLKGKFETSGNIRPEIIDEIAQGVEIAFTSVWLLSPEGWRVLSNDAHIVREA